MELFSDCFKQYMPTNKDINGKDDTTEVSFDQSINNSNDTNGNICSKIVQQGDASSENFHFFSTVFSPFRQLLQYDITKTTTQTDPATELDSFNQSLKNQIDAVDQQEGEYMSLSKRFKNSTNSSST